MTGNFRQARGIKSLAIAASLILATTLPGSAADPQATAVEDAPRQGIQSFFSTTEIQFLAGDGYNLGSSDAFPAFAGENSAVTATIQHFDAWTYGENFFFFDISRETDGANNAEIYGEFYSFLNLLSIAGAQPLGPITGIGPSIGVNIGSSTGNSNFLAVLYGAQVNLQVPGFNVLNFQAYVYDNANDPFNRNLDTTYQLTSVWNIPINISDRVKLQFLGFADFIGTQDIAGGGQLEQQFLTQPQLRLDLGNLLGGQPGWVSAGVEYTYWRNKFGVNNVDDSVVQALLVFKLH
jgi:nucleoside-specific outer membrane channel protein Tsx